MRRGISYLILSAFIVGAAACGGNPTGPSSSDTLDELLQVLRQEGLIVTVAGEISPEANRFFSVPAHQILLDQSRVNVFEYPTAGAAAADGALVSPTANRILAPSSTGSARLGFTENVA